MKRSRTSSLSTVGIRLKKQRGKNNGSSEQSDDEDNNIILQMLGHVVPPPGLHEHHHKDPNDSVFDKDNHIYFRDEVKDSTINKLIALIDAKNDEFAELQKDPLIKHAEPKPLMLHITSNGGLLSSCMRAIDAIKNSKIPVHTIVEGNAASAATMMSVVAAKRYMTKSSYMLIHQLSGGNGGTFWEMKDGFENASDKMDHIYEIYVENTKMKRKQLEQILSHDKWFRLSECLEKGLVDEEYKGE